MTSRRVCQKVCRQIRKKATLAQSTQRSPSLQAPVFLNNQTQQLPIPFQRLIASVESTEQMDPKLAQKYLSECSVSMDDIAEWADFKHPDRDGYGRKMVHDGGFFEVMVMSWVPGDMSAIHDHGQTQWGAVKVLGDAEHAVFKVDADNVLRTKVRNTSKAGETNAVNHSLIHQMGNPGDKPFCSIHMYGCYDHGGSITGGSRIFDLHEDKIQLTDGGVFFCLEESLINARTDGYRADYATQQRHHVEMIKKIDRFLPSLESKGEREVFTDKMASLVSSLLSPADKDECRYHLESLCDANGKILDKTQWEAYWNEIHCAARTKADFAHLL